MDSILFSIVLFIYIINIYYLGHISLKFAKVGSKDINSLENIFFGFIFFGLIGLIINFFISLNLIFNSILFILLIINSVYNIFRDKNFPLKQITVIFFITIFFLIFSKTFEDSAGYHIPFSNVLNEHKIIFGLSNIHFRFGIVSISQYIDSLNYNIFVREKGILVASAVIVATCILYFFSEIKKKKDNNFTYLFLIFGLIFLCLRFNRFGDYGNDAIAHIYFILFSYLIIKNLYDDKINEYKKIYLIALFTFLQKIFFLPALIYVFIVGYFKFREKFFFNKVNFLIMLFIFAWLLKTFVNTGCFIYPIEFTCADVSWYSNDLKSYTSADRVAKQSEAWAKSWNTFGGNIEPDYNLYNSNFFWIENWFKNHFVIILKKMLPVIFFFIIFTMVNNKYLIKSENIKTNFSYIFSNKNNSLFFIFITSMLLLWFFKFPIFRYGSSIIFIFLFYIFAFMYNFKSNQNLKLKNFLILILITIVISKNSLKINKNIEEDMLPNILFDSLSNKKMNKNQIDFLNIYTTEFYGCFYGYTPCTTETQNLDKIKIIKKKGYIFFDLKN